MHCLRWYYFDIHNILVDTSPDYKCTGLTPDVCAIRCGDGILDITAPVE